MRSLTTSSPDVIAALLRTRSALLADVYPGAEDRLLVRSDLSGTMQLYELRGGELHQITALSEPVTTASYVPGSASAVLAIDQGGNEQHQLYLLDLEAATESPAEDFDRLDPLTTDTRFGNHVAGVAPDGRWVAYLSNRANGVDFDLWLCDVATREHRLCYASGAFCHPASGSSPDGRFVAVLRPGSMPLDVELVLVEVETGTGHVPLEHPQEAALVGAPAWIDGSRFYVSSNVGRDFSAIVRHDLETGTTTPLAGTGEDSDAEVVASKDGQTIVVIENRDGSHAMQRYDAVSGTAGSHVPTLEPGIVEHFFFGAPVLSADGTCLYYTLSSPRLGGDVFVHDFGAGVARRLTDSPAEIRPAELVRAEHGEVSSFDGERIPFFVFRPHAEEAQPPVVVLVHGGPESQAMLGFNPIIQALVAVGYGVVVPNVRGSTGYGKRYASLDDTTKRLDSVRDLSAVHGALAAMGFDPGRAVLWGGSYGGFMVLAGLALQPELWAAGVDLVGISNLVTFLENTSDYRRAHREREYGSLEHDREFLIEASPLTHARSIRAPLFVIHGRNDPRVPVAEAEQLTSSLQQRGVRCELLIYEDEGHGLARLENRLDAYPRAIKFLEDVLGSSPRPQG